MTISKDQIKNVLSNIKAPTGEGDIVSLGMVSEPFITQGDDGAKVMFSLTVPTDTAEKMEPLREQAQKAVMEIEGVSSAMVALTAERKPGSAPSSPPLPVQNKQNHRLKNQSLKGSSTLLPWHQARAGLVNPPPQ